MDRHVFLYRGSRKTVLFKCKRTLAVMKKENLKCHYETNHPELKSVDGEIRKMKINEFKKGLYAQQNVMTSFCSTNDDVLTVSYEVSESLKSLSRMKMGHGPRNYLLKLLKSWLQSQFICTRS